MELYVPLSIAVLTIVLMGLGAMVDDRRARARRRSLDDVRRVELPLLHSINDDRCIGCEACVDVCPTEVLELVHHKVQVARFTDCVQCEQCANACPTTALVMYREGTVPKTLTVPELDDQFQTGVPGQYLIGEVAGKPLVKNAANLGRAVVENIERALAGQPSPGGELLDVAIVGSGPGGLSAGLTCLKKQMSCVVLEKEHVISSTVSRYPKGKHFMAEPATVANLSYLPVFDASKEDLVAAWQKVVEAVKLPVKLGEAVETVKRGDDGIFTIKSTVATYRARTVVLATGLRGKPRLLAVPGANLEKVQSRLDDPAEFAGAQVLVVGGGDSAVEAAMSLAEVGATVTLSYRGDGFKRCKQGNQKRLAEMSAANQLAVLLESNVKEFTSGEVSIKLKDGEIQTIPNQYAFVLIGADTPVAWLEANNVAFVEREHLYALGSTEDAVLRATSDAVACPKDADEAVAVLLGTALVRPSHRKEHSIVAQIRDELREAVTELTGVFRLTPAQAAALRGPAAAQKARTAPPPPPPPRRRAATHDGPKLFPHRSLVIRPNEFPAENTVTALAAAFPPERTSVGHRAFRSARDPSTTVETPSLRAVRPVDATDAAATAATAERTVLANAFEAERTAIGESPFASEETDAGTVEADRLEPDIFASSPRPPRSPRAAPADHAAGAAVRLAPAERRRVDPPPFLPKRSVTTSPPRIGRGTAPPPVPPPSSPGGRGDGRK